MELPKLDTIICGDNLAVMRTLPDGCIDAIVTDPPYGLSFMGKKWDYDVPSIEIWAECLRVLKPGGHLLAFAGTRTQHRMAVRIEDAGFEIRDMIAWVYSSGFPKSLNIGKAIDKAAGAEREVVGVDEKRAALLKNQMGDYITKSGWSAGNRTADITAPATEAAKQWDGWGSALKPAMEMISVCRKPLDGTIAQNVLEHGVGGINVDATRIKTDESTARPPSRAGSAIYAQDAYTKSMARGGGGHVQGRFPANLIHDGSDEVVGLFPETTSGSLTGQPRTENKIYGSAANTLGTPRFHNGDSGSAARFFYCAKADSKERRGSNHPTVKPLDLMRYLVRLVSPIGSIVLDPFAGSGTTLEAAKLESCKFIGIEINPEYVEISNKRLEQGVLF